jgi:hypothetical protein
LLWLNSFYLDTYVDFKNDYFARDYYGFGLPLPSMRLTHPPNSFGCARPLDSAYIINPVVNIAVLSAVGMLVELLIRRREARKP